MSFFKQHSQNELRVARTKVFGQNNLVLDSELKDTYQYPVEGWYWFDTFKEAREALLSRTDITLSNRQLNNLVFSLQSGMPKLLSSFNSLSKENREAFISEMNTGKIFTLNDPLVQFIKGVFNIEDNKFSELFEKYSESY